MSEFNRRRSDEEDNDTLAVIAFRIEDISKTVNTIKETLDHVNVITETMKVRVNLLEKLVYGAVILALTSLGSIIVSNAIKDKPESPSGVRGKTEQAKPLEK